jgi:hypothetical protein
MLIQAMLRHTPQRHGIMQTKAHHDQTGDKYRETATRPTEAQLAAHLTGTITLAAPATANGLAACIVIDIDAYSIESILGLLEAARQRGRFAWGEWHGSRDRGYVFIPYDRLTNAQALKAVGDELIAAADIPTKDPRIIDNRTANNAITRLPFGRHTWTGERGELIMQDYTSAQIDADPDAALQLWAAHYRANPADGIALPARTAPTPRPATHVHHRTPLTADLTNAETHAAFNHAVDVCDILTHHGGQRHTAMSWHCLGPTHTNQDKHPSLLMVASTKPERYGQQIIMCYSPGCLFHAADGQVWDAFNVEMQLTGRTYMEQIAHARQVLGLPESRRPAQPAPYRTRLIKRSGPARDTPSALPLLDQGACKGGGPESAVIPAAQGADPAPAPPVPPAPLGGGAAEGRSRGMVSRDQQQRYTTIPALTTTGVGVQAAMGTGKSYTVARAIPAEASLLVITHRVALAQQQAAQFATDFYQDHRHDLSACARLTVTYDSLLKLDPRTRFDYVVLDESEQGLAHVTGGTIKPGERAMVLQMLERMVSQAQRVYYLDADLGPVTTTFMARMHGADDCTLLINHYQPRDRHYIAMPRKEDVLITLKAHVAAGQTAYVAINSRQQVHALALDLQRMDPALRILAISSANSNTPDIQRFIAQINTEIEHYDVVITSPSLGTGISIDTCYFDAVYLIGEAKTTTHTDLIQMAGRVRTIKSGRVYCWIAPQRGAEETNPAILRAHVLANWRETGLRINIAPRTGDISPVDEDYLDLWTAIAASRNASMNDLASNFYARVQRDGHRVSTSSPASDQDRTAARAAQKAARAALDAQRYAAVISAEPLTPAAYRTLHGQFTTSPAEHAQMTQYELCHFYAVAPSALTPALIAADEQGLKRKVKALALLSDGALARADDLDGAQHLIADQQHQSLARELRLELLGRVSPEFWSLLSNPTHSGDTAITIPPDFAGWLLENSERFKRVLNLRVDQIAPMRLVHNALSQLGLALNVRRRKVKGKTQRRYVIDPARLREMQGYVNPYVVRKYTQLALAALE